MTTEHASTAPAPDAMKEPLLLGRWHHGEGNVVCGSLRVLRADFDTNPSAEFQQKFMDWLCDTMNAALKAWERHESSAHAQAAQPVAWVRFCSDGTYEGPIMDCDRRMDAVRKSSGAWTPLYVGSPPSAPGEVVVTKNKAGQIVAVTRQDAEGRILKVIAESAPPSAPAVPVLSASDEACALSLWWRHNKASLTTPRQAAFAAWNERAGRAAQPPEPKAAAHSTGKDSLTVAAPSVEALRAEGKRLQNAFGKATVHATYTVTDEKLEALVQAETALATFIDKLAALAQTAQAAESKPYTEDIMQAARNVVAARAAEPAETLRRGAERYDWLRAQVYVDPEQKILRIANTYVGTGPLPEQLDAAIDAAIASLQTTKGGEQA